MEVLEWLGLLSANGSSSNYLGNSLFIIYIIISIVIKKSRYLLAFSFSIFTFELSLFDILQEYQLYLTVFIAYSYVVLHSVDTKVKIACGIMCLLDLTLAYDAFYYGASGVDGEYKTVLYQNIEYVAFCDHIIIILSLIPFGRIYSYLCGVLDHVFGSEASSYNVSFICYNKIKATN